MAWADHLEASALTNATLTAGQQVYYDRNFLRNAVYNLYMMQFAQKRPLPLGKGKQIEFFGWNEIATRQTKLTEGTNPAGTSVTGHNVNRSLETFGDWAQYSDLLAATHIDQGLKGLSTLFGNQAGRTIDLRIMKEVVCNGSHSISADTDAAACGVGLRPGQWHVTESTSTASTASIIYAETAVATGDLIFDDTNDWFAGGLLTSLDGANQGQSRFVYNSVASTNSVYVYPAFENTPAVASTYLFTHPGKKGAAVTANVLGTSDVLTHKVFAITLEDLQTYAAPTYEGGYYIMVVGPTTNRGFMTDTAGGWMGLAQYRGQELYKGEIGKYMGFRVVQTQKPFRCPLPAGTEVTLGPGATSSTDYSLCGTNYAEGGAGHYSLAFGKGAFACTTLAGKKTPKIIAHAPGSSGSVDPLDMQGSVGWKLDFVPAALNARWCVSVVSGG